MRPLVKYYEQLLTLLFSSTSWLYEPQSNVFRRGRGPLGDASVRVVLTVAPKLTPRGEEPLILRHGYDFTGTQYAALRLVHSTRTELT